MDKDTLNWSELEVFKKAHQLSLEIYKPAELESNCAVISKMLNSSINTLRRNDGK